MTKVGITYIVSSACTPCTFVCMYKSKQSFLKLTIFLSFTLFSRNQSGTLPPVKLVVLARGGTSFKSRVRDHKREDDDGGVRFSV